MKRSIIRLWFVIVLQFSTLSIIWSSPQMHATTTGSTKNIMVQTLFSVQIKETQLVGKFCPRVGFYDNGIIHFTPNLSLHLKFPFEGSFGDFSKDTRIASFFKTGFSLTPLEEKDRGSLKSIPLTLESNASGAIAFSQKIFKQGYGHLCAWSPLSAEAGFGGIAALVEWQGECTLLQGGVLVTELLETGEHDWLISYYALPIASGSVGYLSLDGKYPSLHPNVSIRSALLLRLSYDRANGIGLTNSIGLKIAAGNFVYSLQRITIHQELGSVGREAFTTLDAPLQLIEMSGNYRRANCDITVVLCDKRWRPTVYAAMFQRRRQQLSGSLSFPVFSYNFYLHGRYEKRWNRSGSIGKTVMLSTRVRGEIGGVMVSYEPTLTFGKHTILSGEIGFSKEVNKANSIQIRLMHTSHVVKLSGVWLYKWNNSRLKLEYHNDGRVSIFYSIYPIR